MAVVIASDLGKDIAGSPLLRGVSFKLERRDRMTLSGRNGSGKTTLLRMLGGEASIDSGKLSLQKGAKVALHDQRPPRERDLTLRDYVLSGARDVVALEQELGRLEHVMADGPSEESTLEAYAATQARFELHGGYRWRDRALVTMRGLGFHEGDLDREVSSFSGGELTRGSLARVLTGEPDLLLLDEPTNHLDIASLEWLEQHLKGLDAAIVLVAHDRWFLEEVGTSVLELEAGRARFFKGPWHLWRKEKAAREIALGREIERQQAEIARMERFVERFRAKATKARQAQDRVKKLEKMERGARSHRRALAVLQLPRAGTLRPGGVRARRRTDRGPRTGAAGRRLVGGGARRARVGRGRERERQDDIDRDAHRPPPKGKLRSGHNVSVGYVSQHAEELAESGTVLDAAQRATGLTPGKARALLGLFLFSGDDAQKPVAGLSGGELRRLSLAVLVNSGANTLVLDEPTTSSRTSWPIRPPGRTRSERALPASATPPPSSGSRSCTCAGRRWQADGRRLARGATYCHGHRCGPATLPRMRLAGAFGALLLTLMLVPAAWAGPPSTTTAAVSLGDSYISGEAGRWAGNSLSPGGDKDGTDRACQPAGPACQVDKTRVYEPGTENGACHRSDVAEIKSASLPADERIDLSCSGAKTQNIFRASQGGTGQNGEAAQADKLLPVARAKNVKLVMLSIGGNDLGFASIIQACLTAYETMSGPCNPSQQKKLDALKPTVTAAVGKAIDEVRAVMSTAGYRAKDYRLIVQTYPSVAPRAKEVRYPESGPDRTANGCPFYDADADWARDRAAPQIGAVLKAAADSRGVETLDLVNAFQGHEFCSKTAAQNTPLFRPAAADAEWGRFLGASTVQQGELQEAFHPNAYGQLALGRCVTQTFAGERGRFTCTGAAGLAPSALSVARIGAAAKPASCQARRSRIGRALIGRLKLGVTRGRLGSSPRLAALRAPAMSTRRFRYCVKRSKGHVSAVFGKRAKVELLIATAGRYGNRAVHPGVSLRKAKRAFRRMRRVAKGVYRLGPSSRRIVGVRKGRVRFVGVASKRVLRSKRLVRAFVKRA